MKITEKNYERYKPSVLFYRREILAIHQIVCDDYHNSDFSNSLEKSRFKNDREPRQLTHYLANKYTAASAVIIGHLIGDLDHATVLHSDKTIKQSRKLYKAIDSNIKKLENRIEKELGLVEIKNKIPVAHRPVFLKYANGVINKRFMEVI